jgi:hypothetical protein
VDGDRSEMNLSQSANAARDAVAAFERGLSNMLAPFVDGADDVAPPPPAGAPNPGHHPQMHAAPHDTEITHRASAAGRDTYTVKYAGRLKTPLPNLEDTRIFHFTGGVRHVPNGRFGTRQEPLDAFYGTVNGNKVASQRHWWLKTGRSMIGQASLALARSRAHNFAQRVQRTPRAARAARAESAPRPDAPPLAEDLARPPDGPALFGAANESHVAYARARFYARSGNPTRRREARRHYSIAVERAIEAGIEVPDPPAGLEDGDESAPTPRGIPMPPARTPIADDGAAAPAPRQTALGASAARAVQSSQLPPADAPEAASFGLAPLAVANESERERLTSCAICFDEDKPRVALFAPCGHLAACLRCYHAACAADARNARTCPICKAAGKPVLLRLA